jgi:hypothetical protein
MPKPGLTPKTPQYHFILFWVGEASGAKRSRPPSKRILAFPMDDRPEIHPLVPFGYGLY